MARDDRFKRYQEAGADFLETARTRAEEFLQELAKMGDSTQKQAQGAVDDLVDGGRKGTEQILATIRREITAQLSQLGLATKQELADLERRLTGAVAPGDAGPEGAAQPAGPPSTMAPAAAPAATAAPAAGPAGAPATAPKKVAPAKAAAKKASAAKAAPHKAPAKKAASKKAAPVKKAAGEV
jgi:polyhydroxyalkanoate synthesis regulator phasin